LTLYLHITTGRHICCDLATAIQIVRNQGTPIKGLTTQKHSDTFLPHSISGSRLYFSLQFDVGYPYMSSAWREGSGSCSSMWTVDTHKS